MKLLSQIFGKKRPNSSAIVAELEKARAQQTTAIARGEAALSGLSTMSDAEHMQAEAEYQAQRRAAERAAARIADLEQAHADALEAEADAEKLAEAERFRQRVEAARYAVEVEGAERLRSYRSHAAAMADELDRLDAINAEANSVNDAMRHNPIAERVRTIDEAHRKHPDRPASERTEPRKCWVYRYPGSPPDAERLKFLREAPWEDVREATLKPDGTPVPVPPALHDYYGRQLTIRPILETREIVVERTSERCGRVEASLSDITLPPAFAGEDSYWPLPRKS